MLGKIRERLLAPPGPYVWTEALFIRALGLIYLFAFGSLLPQLRALVGSNGIVPAWHSLAAIREGLGPKAYVLAPSLFWFGVSDGALWAICVAGSLAAALMVIGFMPRSCAAVCYVTYLSLCTVAQPFTGFQWDALLLEAGFLALFAGAPWLVWGYRFLLFRLMFESGAVKFLSNDINWRNLHALRFHFLTQPLPNPIAYYAYRAPKSLLDACTAATLAIEFVAPFLLFGPRRVRQVGAWLLIVLQLVIMLTGNYAFFNYLTVALCLWGFDDVTFGAVARILRKPVKMATIPALRAGLNGAVVLLVMLGAIQLLQMFSPAFGGALSEPLQAVAPFEIVNGYGLFAVMTTTRPEIVLEGSDDQVTWREYSFPYKPGELHRGLPFVAPYQPRLDWQMWFAALGPYEQSTWVEGLMYRLLLGHSPVDALIGPSPFAKPPRYMRALLYEYQFTTPAERARTGAVWTRQLLRTWFGPVSLSGT